VAFKPEPEEGLAALLRYHEKHPGATFRLRLGMESIGRLSVQTTSGTTELLPRTTVRIKDDRRGPKNRYRLVLERHITMGMLEVKNDRGRFVPFTKEHAPCT